MEDTTILERELYKSHHIYTENIKKIYPGSSHMKDNYCKAISMIQQTSEFIKEPEEQLENINKTLQLFESKDEAPKLLYLYCDFLQYNQLKEMENRNSPKEIKELLLNHFIQKFFQLNNKKEKIISRSNNLINSINYSRNTDETLKAKSLNMVKMPSADYKIKSYTYAGDANENVNVNNKNSNSANQILGERKEIEKENFTYINDVENNLLNNNQNNTNCDENIKNNFTTENIYEIKNLKVDRINREIDSTLKRILRILEEEDVRSKDFEYYLKHFKLKKLDTLFLKKEQVDLHFNLRKDDFEVYLREICFKDKLFYELRNFEPFFKFVNLKSGFDIWKNSKIFLKGIIENIYQNEIQKLELIYNFEKSRCSPAERKLFKEYFKHKYKYYYLLKEKVESQNLKNKLMRSYVNDICYPPMIITMNSEIQYYLKELCDHYSLEFDISIDKGKAYYYYLDGKIPEIFGNQKNYFNYNLYEIVEIEEMTKISKLTGAKNTSTNAISGLNLVNNLLGIGLNGNEDDQMFKLEYKVTDILRDKYHLTEGFNVHSEYNLNDINLKNSNFRSEIFKKKANWLDFICVYPKIDQKYISNKKKIDAIGYIDSMLIYELHLIGEVDLNTLNRLVEDYTLNFKSRNKKNLKNLTTKSQENEYNPLRHLVKDIIENNEEINSHLISDVKKKLHMKADNAFLDEDYTDKINLDLLRYFLILRFLKIRDVKFWIINILNYFRFIQKKFVIDLYKIENKNWRKADDYDNLIYTLNEYPYDKSAEKAVASDSSKDFNAQNNINNRDDGKKDNNNENNNENIINSGINNPNSSTLDEKVLIEKDVFDMLDKTNPIIPSYDVLLNSVKNNCGISNANNNENLTNNPNDVNNDDNNNKNIQNETKNPNQADAESENFSTKKTPSSPIKSNSFDFSEAEKAKEKLKHTHKDFFKVLLDEIEESAEFSDENKTIRIKDSKGNYIIYDATISDMEQLEAELGRIGTFYIHKREELIVDPEKTSNPLIDRSQVILDLFSKEFEFLQAKLELVNQLMFVYDNTTDVILQKSLIQIITDLIAQRPVLDLNFYYFSENYILETEIVRKKTAFLKKLVFHQINLEIDEVRRIHEKNDKLYWLLGECALDLIKNIRLDKLDVHLLKEFINQKRKELERLKTLDVKNVENDPINDKSNDKVITLDADVEIKDENENQNLNSNRIKDIGNNENMQIKNKENELQEIENFVEIFEKIIQRKKDFKEDLKVNNAEVKNKTRNNKISGYAGNKNLECSKQSYITPKKAEENELEIDNDGNIVNSSNLSTINQDKINTKSIELKVKEEQNTNKCQTEKVPISIKKDLNFLSGNKSINKKKKYESVLNSEESDSNKSEKEDNDNSDVENQEKLEAAKQRLTELNLLNALQELEVKELEKNKDTKTLEEIEKDLKSGRESKAKKSSEIVSNNNINNNLIEEPDNIFMTQKDKKAEKVFSKLNLILKFLKKLFANTISKNSQNAESNRNIFNLNYYQTSPNSEADSELTDEELQKISDLDLIENYEPFKKFLSDNNIPLGENPNQSRRFYSLYARSSVNVNNNLNNNIDNLNFQIRSLLNIPNSFKDKQDKNLVEKNAVITSSLKDEINFNKFNEGFPMKILNDYKNEDFFKIGNKNLSSNFLRNFDFFESLSVLIPTLNFMSEGFSEVKNSFKSENYLNIQAIELCVYENYMINWDRYIEFISGNSNNSEYESLLYLNNTLLNNPENMMYMVKNLTATLSNSINRIPPQLIAKLPISILEKMEIDLLEFKDPSENLNVLDLQNIENIELEELNLTLMRILKKDVQAGWLNVNSHKNLSEVKFFCNLVELYRVKMLIERLINYSITLSSIYDKQKEVLLGIKDNLLTFKKPLNLEFSQHLQSKKNFVDNWDYYINKLNLFSSENPSSAPKLLISEFEPTFQYCMNFHDLLTCQMNLLDAGLYEVKTFAQYQYMQYYLLLVGTQYNYNFVQEVYTHMCELDLLENNKIIIFNSSLDLNRLFENLDDVKFTTHLSRLRSKANIFINKLGREFFFNILDRKFQQREFIEKKYHAFLENQINVSSKGYTINRILSRHYRLVYTNAYCKEKMTEVYLESIKLQASKSAKVLKSLLHMIPKEYREHIFDINTLNFLENENKVFNFISKNFMYFTDRKAPFNSFYIPSDVEIMRLESQSSSDRIYHYRQYQPLYRIEEINNAQFFSQINDFFKSPTLKNSVDFYRNKFFTESISYQSNAFLLLQYLQFFINTLNFKFMEMATNIKSEDLMKLIESNEKGIDFWGDKRLITPLNTNVEDNKLPLHIVENIINDEKNYMNLRLNFDKFKIEFESILENLRSYVKSDDEAKKPIIFMQSYTEITTNFWLFIFYRIRESSIKSRDFTSSVYLTKLIKSIKNYDYFRASICNFPCHINDFFMEEMQNNQFNFYNPGMIFDSNYKGVDEIANINKNNIILNNNDNTKRISFSDSVDVNHPLNPNGNSNNNKKSEFDSKQEKEQNAAMKGLNLNSPYITNDSNCSNNLLYKNKSFNLKNIFMKSLSFYKSGDGEAELQNIRNNFYKPTVNAAFLDAERLSAYSSIKYDFLFLSERRFGEVRNLCFKMNSLVEKFMIFLEINRNNTDSIELNKRKINFFDIYVKICEFKYKYYIISSDRILNFNEIVLENLEKELREAYSDIIPNDNLEDLNEKIIGELVEKIEQKTNYAKDAKESNNHAVSGDTNKNTVNNNQPRVPKVSISKRFFNINIRNSLDLGAADQDEDLKQNNIQAVAGEAEEDDEISKHKNFLRGKSRDRTNLKSPGPTSKNSSKVATVRKSSLIFLKLMESQKENVILEDVLINNKLVEYNIKLEQHIIIEYLLKGSKLLFDFYKNRIKVFLLRKSLNTLNRENTALVDLFNYSKSDLDLNKFQNKFTCALLKNLDDLHYTTINRKFSFFETFFNKIQNISLEVETHTVSNALIITKYEFENSIKNLIRDFIIYDTNIRNFTNYTNAAENFGLFTKLKKQENLIKILKQKLKDYDSNFEKICNAKLALQGNRTIYEMDHLYRQVNILRDNIRVMEEYIKSFFEEKFRHIVTELKTQSGIIESKFTDFREGIVSATVQNITEEYNNCLAELKNKHMFLAEAAKSLQENAGVNKTDKSGEAENSFFEHFHREMEIETNYNKEINRERKKNDNLYEDISKLHAYYRMKLNMQKTEYEKQTAELNQKLSSNQDLWDKLGIAEKNEKVLKEELSKTQKSLAYAEEFNKKLQTQIRKSHDTNTNLQKQISLISANQIINNAAKGENIKALELHEETKNVYIYNNKSNQNLVSAVERIKKILSNNSEESSIQVGNGSTKDILYVADVKIILDNLEGLHLKYTQEVDNKRNFVNMLNKLKTDITNMREVNKLNFEEANNRVKHLTEQLNKANLEIEIIKKNCLNPNHVNNSHMAYSNLNGAKADNTNFGNNKNNFNLASGSNSHNIVGFSGENVIKDSQQINSGNINLLHNQTNEFKDNLSARDNLNQNNNVNYNIVGISGGNLNGNFTSSSNINNLNIPIAKLNLAPLKHQSNSSNNLQIQNILTSNQNTYRINLTTSNNNLNLNNNNSLNLHSNSLSNSVTSKNNFGMVNNPMNTSGSNNFGSLQHQSLKEPSSGMNMKNKPNSLSKNKNYPLNFTKTSANFNQANLRLNQLNNNLDKNLLDIVNVNLNVNPIFSSNLLHTMNSNMNTINCINTSGLHQLTSEVRDNSNKIKSSRVNNLSNINHLHNNNGNLLTTNTHNSNANFHKNQLTINSQNILDSEREIVKITKNARLGDFNTESSFNDSLGNNSNRKYFDNNKDQIGNEEKNSLNVNEDNNINNINKEKDKEREKSNSRLIQTGMAVISDNY